MPRKSKPDNTAKTEKLTHAQRDSLPNAGFWRRVGAMIYDSLLVIALVMSLLLIAVALTNNRIESAYSQPLSIVACYGFLRFSGYATGKPWACSPGGWRFSPIRWPAPVEIP